MMLKEELKELGDNTKKDAKQLYEKVKQYPLISLFFIIAVLLLIVLPHWQVSGINNATEKIIQENQSRATFAQILGGIAIGIGLYYTWRRITIAEEDLKATQENLKVTQENLKVSQEGQITERFTRAIEQLGAIDQLGNPAVELRLGGIYALERIASESEKDYWPIMEILTAYVRKNSSAGIVENKRVSHPSIDIQANESITSKVPEVKEISLDIQAILKVIGRREKYFGYGESESLDLRKTDLRRADLMGTHLENAYLLGAHLEWANLGVAYLQKAHFESAHLERAHLTEAHLEGAFFIEAHLERTYLIVAHLEKANFINAHLQETNFEYADLRGAYLRGANLKDAYLEHAYLMGADFKEADLSGAYLKDADLSGAKYLTIDQLSKVKTLYNAKLDEELLIPVKEKYRPLFEKPEKWKT